jgi:type VI secretion system protein ImpJ
VVLAKQVSLLPPFVPRSGYVAFPVVRLRRQADGAFDIDPTFVAPSLSSAASPALSRQLDALMHKLQAKIDALYAVQREPGQNVVVQGGDASSFWLLQTISAGAASLHHHAQCPGLHPERLFQDLLGLAGGLMVFSRRFGIPDLPGYDHEQPGIAFARLDAILRDLVDQVISTRHLAIALRQDAARPSYYEGSLPPDAVGAKDLLCLAVRADLPARVRRTTSAGWWHPHCRAWAWCTCPRCRPRYRSGRTPIISPCRTRVRSTQRCFKGWPSPCTCRPGSTTWRWSCS